MGEITSSEIKAMSVAERLDLIERIWDSLVAEPHELPMPAWHVGVLEDRLADYGRDPDAGSSWDDVKKRLATGPRT